MPDPAVTAIVERTADAASVAWAHEGVGNVAALPDPLAAIAAAAALGNTAALQSVNAPKDLRKAASAALHKLKSKGVKIEEVAAPRAFTLAKESFDLPSRAFLSVPDIDGDIELTLTTSDATGNCALGMLVSAGTLKEMRHAHLGRGDLRDLWKQAEGRTDLVEIPFTTGLHYAERFSTAGEHKHDWHHFLEHVPPATLQSARVLDPLAKAPAPEEEGGPTPWIAPPGVLDHDALESGIQRLVDIGRADFADDAARDAAHEALYREVADAALADGDRAALARAAELAAAAFAFHRRAASATSIRAQGEAAVAGAPGSSIEGVLMATRLVLISHAQARIQERVREIDAQLGAAVTESAE